ncbi:uncharacterized protein PHACADRAFT_82859, partial [Phanerochaete carnosa HHB-10118-sp]
YMAVTAHWLQLVLEDRGNGLQPQLRLRADLIGFHCVPSSHTSEHLVAAFLYILNRIKITNKIGWITMDNATNNDACMEALEQTLRKRGIAFDKLQHCIRCVYFNKSIAVYCSK